MAATFLLASSLACLPPPPFAHSLRTMDDMTDHASEDAHSRSSSYLDSSPAPSTPAYELNNLRSGRYVSTMTHDPVVPSPAMDTALVEKDAPFVASPGVTSGRDFEDTQPPWLGSASEDIPDTSAPHMDIATYPSAQLLKMLAALLQHIATSNDQLRPVSNALAPQPSKESPRPGQALPFSPSHLMLNDPRRPTITTAALATLNAPNSTLCFHARHIPSINIEAYLLRILKYCPVTNDVFLSLLVYFDRLSRVGAIGHFPGDLDAPGSLQHSTDVSSSEDDDTESDSHASAPSGLAFPGIRGFAIDSYNVHRLIIAGITVASKFFSDVFYTNARYAKVGGLAVHELNQLELHFLLLTDFRLTIPITEIQHYGDQLLAYANDRMLLDPAPTPVCLPEQETSEAVEE